MQLHSASSVRPQNLGAGVAASSSQELSHSVYSSLFSGPFDRLPSDRMHTIGRSVRLDRSHDKSTGKGHQNRHCFPDAQRHARPHKQQINRILQL